MRAVLPLIVLLVPDDSEGGCRPRSSGVAPCHRPLEEEARPGLAARRCLATGLSTPRWLGVDTDSPSHCPPLGRRMLTRGVLSPQGPRDRRVPGKVLAHHLLFLHNPRPEHQEVQ